MIHPLYIDNYNKISLINDVTLFNKFSSILLEYVLIRIEGRFIIPD